MDNRDNLPGAGRVRIPFLATGVSNLDTILGGGLPALSLTMLVGSPGTGKTTLAHQLLFALGTPERPGLYFSVFGEPTMKLLRYQQQFSFFDPTRVGRDVRYFDLADTVRAGGVPALWEAITEEVRRYAPILVVIDSFRAVAERAQTDGGNARSFTHDLALLLTSWDTTSVLVDDYPPDRPEREPELAIADGIILLSQEARLNAVTRKLQVIKLRGAPALPGRHSFRIDGDGLHMYPRLSPITSDRAPKPEGRATFGVPGLDAMLRGGIPRGQACLIAGSSGTGKTVLALHYLVAGARANEPGVLLTFEERPQEHIRKARSFGWDLEALEAQGLLRIIALRPVDLSVDEVLGAIQEAVTAVGAQRVALNSVSGFQLAISAAEKDDFQEGLYRLVVNLTNQGVSIVLTTEISDLFGDVRISTPGASFIADNVVLLRYAEIESSLRKVLMVVKMRTSDHDKELRQFRIGETGVVVEEPFTEYSGVLSGIPVPRVLTEPRPFTAGLAQQEEALAIALSSLREAGADELAATLGWPLTQVRELLEKLTDTGYVVRTQRNGTSVYRVVTTPAVPRPRPNRRRSSGGPSPSTERDEMR